MSDNYFDLLPPDVKLRIFSYLSLKELINTLSLNRNNFIIYKDNVIWRKRLQQDYNIECVDDAAGAAFEKYKQQALRRRKIICPTMRLLLHLEMDNANIGAADSERIIKSLNEVLTC